MKRFLVYGLLLALFSSCSTKEIDIQTPVQDDVVFYASFEQPSGVDDTRVYANKDLLLRWTADDRVSIFNKLTYNQEYEFTGQTGANAGGFKKVDNDEFVTGNAISHVVSVYPYKKATTITEDEVISLTFPAEQAYAENTFGLGANTMVSVSSDNVLQYKNVGGYLMLKLYGDGISVSSITLKGNNGEKLAGNATVTMLADGNPSVTMANDASTEITLICETPVQLGATEEESTQFWFVVPPITFDKGFTITLNKESDVAIEKSTSKSTRIERAVLAKMSPLKVEGKIVLSANSFNVSGFGEDIYVDVCASNMPIIGEIPNWVSYSSGTYSNGSIRFVFHISRNNTSAKRSTTVIVSAHGFSEESFIITQDVCRTIERADWSIKYIGREDWVNDDGSVDKVEHFHLKYTDNDYYIIRLIHPEDYCNVYKNDAAVFFSYEVQKLLSDAKADNISFYQYTDEVFSRSITEVNFKRKRSGSWIAFLIELDSSGNVTGNYAKSDFSIQEEVASDAFNRWLGVWQVSNGLVHYDLKISSIDNNYIYKVEGWEQGPAVSLQMDQEYIEGEFYEPNGNLYIVSQYVGTYEDMKLGIVDEFFIGNIFESDDIIPIKKIGLDIAMMVPYAEGRADLKPLEVVITSDSGQNTTVFDSMQYYMRTHETEEWHPYNTNVATLPLTMTKVAGTSTESISIAKLRSSTKTSIHYNQPKSRKTARNRVSR